MSRLKIYGAVGGAVALVLIWPLAVGKIGQDAIEQLVDNANSQTVSAKVVSYDRGYLSSVVKTEFTVKDPTLIQQLKADDIPTSFFVTSDISHGIYSLTAHSTLDDNAKLPLTMDSTTLLNGNTNYKIDLGQWNVTANNDKEKFTVSTSPSYLSGSIAVSGEATYKLNVPSVEVDFASKEKLSIKSLTGEGQGKREGGFWLGEQTLKLSKVDITDPDGKSAFSLEGAQYKFNSKLDEKDTRIESHNVLSVKNVKTTDGGDVSDLVLDATLGDIDKQSFSELMSLFQNNQELSQADLQKAIPYVDTLFSKGFYLAIEQFSMNVGKGKFNSDWKFIIPQGTDNVTHNPGVIMSALKGHINSYFSNELVKEYPFMKHTVEGAVANKMVKQSNDGYELKAKIEDGNLVFEDGQKIPLLSLFLSGMMQQQTHTHSH